MGRKFVPPTHDRARKPAAPAHNPARQPSAIRPFALQPKLAVSRPGDAHEQEADRVADRVVGTSGPHPRHAVGGPPPDTPGAEEGAVRVQTMHADGAATPQSEAPPSVADTLSSPGTPLEPDARAFMESRFGHDFGRVRVHTDARAAASAESLNAVAYTAGSHIVFGAGQYAAGTAAGRRLLAHELTHAIQQQGVQGGLIARQPKPGPTTTLAEVVIPKDDPNAYLVFYDPAIKKDRRLLLPAGTRVEVLKKTGEWREVKLVTGPEPNRTGLLKEKFLAVLPAETKSTPAADAKKAEPQQPQPQGGGAVDPLKRSAKEIMADDKYIDNHIKRMEFYAAEEAHVYYEDGSKLELGLVPPHVKDPFEGVDYHTARSVHGGVTSDEPGVFKYLPRGSELKTPPGVTLSDVLDKLTRTVTFKVEAKSNRIVPTQVNTLTAPTLCQMLMQSEEEYGKLMDATSEGGVKVFTSFKHVLEIYSLLPGGAIAKSAQKAAAGAAAQAGESAAAKLVKKLIEVLGKGGVAKEVVVEGVSLGEVVISRKAGGLAVEYTFIENIGRVAGQGRMVHVALEKAAVEVASLSGLKQAQVIVHTVVNPKWAAYLESLGYTKTLLEKAGEFGFEAVWMRVLPVPG
ncbi:MAG TPA: DUF4157 domain-containing protein [Pyrinomonadaceae bacterium]|jgi:hypothetical protein|nr:DUF4157 domain-containing protein [Pyrinomonadaceae bacterium]